MTGAFSTTTSRSPNSRRFEPLDRVALRHDGSLAVRFLHSRRYLLYVPISVTASGLMFLRSFMYAHIFSVESFGLLNQAILVASTFTALAGLGFHHAAQKLLPQYHTRGQRADFDALLVTCIQVCLVSALVAALVLTIASLL